MLNAQQRDYLIDLARRSIAHGLAHNCAAPVDPASAPTGLTQTGAAFVTLNLHGQLRGCIGSLEAHRSLLEDIAENAYAAAFRDPRFAPVSASELAQIELHISVLSTPQPLLVQSEAELIARLQVGVDGLILQDGIQRATFLPSVWEVLPEPQAFVEQLKRKAGWSARYWSPTLRVYTYRTEQFGEAD